jgi:hypothetical protein
VKFEGKSDYVSISKNTITVLRLKANKLGEYSFELGLSEGNPRMNVSVETRGKMASFTTNLALNNESFSSIKLRKKGVSHPEDR